MDYTIDRRLGGLHPTQLEPYYSRTESLAGVGDMTIEQAQLSLPMMSSCSLM